MREFVHKAVVHQAEKINSKHRQKTELYFNYVEQVIYFFVRYTFVAPLIKSGQALSFDILHLLYPLY